MPVPRGLREPGGAVEASGGEGRRDGGDTADADGLEEVGIKLKVPGQIVSSHSGRKTCVSAGMEMGALATVMKEWMLTATDQTERYRQRGYVLNEEVGQLVDFLVTKE